MRATVPAVAALLAFTACSAGHSGVVPTPSARYGTAMVTLRVPLVSRAASSSSRTPRYLSAGTRAITLAAATGPVNAFNVGASAPGCTAASSVLTCQFTVTLPLYQQQLTVNAYDQPLANGTAQGTILSTLTETVFIQEGSANQLNLVLGGIVGSLSVTVDPLVYWDGSTAKIYIVAKDPDGYTIVGPYATPISLSYTGTPTALLDPYAPNPVPDSSTVPDVVCTFGAPANGTVTVSATNSSGTIKQTVPIVQQIPSGTFALSNTYNSSGNWYGAVDVSTPIDRAGQPMIVVPKQFYGGTSKIEGVAFDPSGNVDVANAGSMSVTIHAPGSQNTDSPINSFPLPPSGGTPTAVAADATRIYVLTATAVEIFTSSGTPVATISGSSTGLAGASSIAVDAAGIYVTDKSANAIDLWPLSANGNAAPTVIAGSATGLAAPRGITVNGATLYVANTGNADVRAWPETSSGNAAPSRILTGNGISMISPYGLGFDAAGNLYVADSGVGKVLVLPGARDGSPRPTQQISIVDNDVANGTGMSVWPF
jgi:hypothetical protein